MTMGGYKNIYKKMNIQTWIKIDYFICVILILVILINHKINKILLLTNHKSLFRGHRHNTYHMWHNPYYSIEETGKIGEKKKSSRRHSYYIENKFKTNLLYCLAVILHSLEKCHVIQFCFRIHSWIMVF